MIVLTLASIIFLKLNALIFFFFLFYCFQKEKNPCKIQKSTTLLLYVILKYLKHAIANHKDTLAQICLPVYEYECGYIDMDGWMHVYVGVSE